MHVLHVLAAPTLVAGLLLVPVTPAAAAEETFREPEIAWVNKNVVARDDGESATLLVKYRCWGEGVHLWGSAKQGPALAPPERTSSAYAESWRETPEGPTPTCDGRWQTERVLLIATENAEDHDPLTSGPAWVQFVIFAADPETFDPDTWEGVHRAAWAGWHEVRGDTAG